MIRKIKNNYSKAETIPKLTVHLQLLYYLYCYTCKNLCFVNDEFRVGCPFSGHTTLQCIVYVTGNKVFQAKWSCLEFSLDKSSKKPGRKDYRWVTAPKNPRQISGDACCGPISSKQGLKLHSTRFRMSHLPGTHLPEMIFIICPKGLYLLP